MSGAIADAAQQCWQPSIALRLIQDTALIVATAILTACAGILPPADASKPVPPPPPRFLGGKAPNVSVGVLEEGWHTELVLPARAVGQPLAGLRASFPAAAYLAIGWGNRAFYMASHPGLGMEIAALFPSSSAVLVEGLPAQLDSALPHDARLRWLCLPPADTWRLDVYLGDYLSRGTDGAPVTLAPGPLPDSRFFASSGTYDALHTCNTWTIAALEFAGLPVRAGGIVFAHQATSAIRSLPSCPPPRWYPRRSP